MLTKPSKGVKNDGYDNEDSDYILYVNDILGSEEAGHKYVTADFAAYSLSFDLTFIVQEPLPHSRCVGPRHIWSGGEMPESEDARSGGCQGYQEQDGVLQSEHDGSLCIRSCKCHTCSAYPLSLGRPAHRSLLSPQLNSKYDKNDDHHLLRLKDTFIHRQHLCLAFELLSVNLYELIKQNQFRGLSTTLVRVFAQQLLNALSLLNKAHLIHCDLKPENILLKKSAHLDPIGPFRKTAY